MKSIKNKILVINSTLETSGLTNVIYNICKNIDYSKFDIHIITLSPENAKSKIEDFKKLPIKITSLNLSRAEWILNGKKKLIKEVDKINPDIIHTQGLRGSYFAFKYLSNYKRIVTLQAILEKNYSDTYGKLIGRYFAKKELVAFKNATARTVVSKHLKNHYQNIYKNIQCIQNGVDSNLYYPIDELKKTELKKKLNIPLDKIIIISLGQLTDRKDPLTIINSFKSIKNNNDYQLIFLGEGPLKSKCIETSIGLNITFPGNVNNAHEYLKIADCYISASLSEGFPNSVLEAGMTGLTCILSDIPQHKEIFEPNSKQAKFFETKSVKELTGIFNNLKIEENKELINFSAKKMTIEYENLYSDLISSHPTK